MSEIYNKYAQENGTLSYNGKEYAFVSDADYTNALLPDCYTNYNDACTDEEYDFEMSASAIDEEGNCYEIFWIFTGIKGEDDYELDSYDYNNIDRIEESDFDY